jgi:hypothetical protein
MVVVVVVEGFVSIDEWGNRTTAGREERRRLLFVASNA